MIILVIVLRGCKLRFYDLCILLPSTVAHAVKEIQLSILQAVSLLIFDMHLLGIESAHTACSEFVLHTSFDFSIRVQVLMVSQIIFS